MIFNGKDFADNNILNIGTLFDYIFNLCGCKSEAFDKLFNVNAFKVDIVFNPVN